MAEHTNTNTNGRDSVTNNDMPVWISDNELDPKWIQEKLQNVLTATTTTTIIVQEASVQDISNDTRKGAAPKDGATLKVTLKYADNNNNDNDNSDTTKLPNTMVIKQNLGNNKLSVSLGLAREALFYKHLAPKLLLGNNNNNNNNSTTDNSMLLNIPKIYYSYGNWKTGEKIIIMEDLSSSNTSSYIDSGILFGPGNPNNWNRDLMEMIDKAYASSRDHLVVPSAQQVAHATFQAIAKVHATFWQDEGLLLNSNDDNNNNASEWLRGAKWVQGQDEASWRASQDFLQDIYQSGIEDKVQWDPLVKSVVDHAMSNISWEAQLKRLNQKSHWTLVHGDFWPGNILVSTKSYKDLKLLDWEMTGIGSGPQDLGQYILSNMDVQERRACEEQLVKDYYNELVRLGVTNFTWEECWNEYCIGGVERWLWFLVYFCGQQGPLLAWAQFFHDQIAAFLKDHNLQPNDFVQPRP